MSLAKFTGLPLMPVGYANRQGATQLSSLTATTIDAVNEACNLIGCLYWEDGGSHTVDTTGSSSIQWRSGTTTFADAGTTVKVGLAAVDTSTGPPSRAANVADVITYDVVASFTGGGGGITSAAWQTSVPTSGTKTIASGDLLAMSIQMTARGGADSVLVSNVGGLSTATIPGVTAFTGGSYNASNQLPNMVIVASDGTIGYIFGGYVADVGSTTQTWNNASGTKEYGNILRFPFPVRAYGIVANNSGGDLDLILYSDPLGTPAAQRTVSVDANTMAASSTFADGRFPFSSPLDLAANTDYAVILKPTTATNVNSVYKTFNNSSHQNSEPLGTGCYAINRNTGAFAAQNSSKDRFAIGLLVGAFEHGVWPAGHLGV